MDAVNTQPYFSILVPVYNTEAYLRECLDSVLSQNFTDYELLLTDDGSTDGSPAILDAYASEDPRIRVFHKENRGLLHTRRFAISRAAGSHIVFLDSDDRLAPNMLSILHEAFESSGCDGVFFGNIRFTGDKITIAERLTRERRVIRDRRELYRTCFLNDTFNSLWMKSVRTSMFDGRSYENYYHISAGEDLLQSMEILENCSSVLLLPDVLYQYRKNPGSITHVRRFDSYSLEMLLPSLVTDFLEKQNVFTESDFRDLRNYFTRAMLEKIASVCRFSSDPKERNANLSTIRSCPYVRDYVSGAPFSRADLGNALPLLKAFLSRRYRLTAALVRFYDCVILPVKKLLRRTGGGA